MGRSCLHPVTDKTTRYMGIILPHHMKLRLRKKTRRSWIDDLSAQQRRKLARNLREIIEPVRSLTRDALRRPDGIR